MYNKFNRVHDCSFHHFNKETISCSLTLVVNCFSVECFIMRITVDFTQSWLFDTGGTADSFLYH